MRLKGLSHDLNVNDVCKSSLLVVSDLREDDAMC